MEDGFPKTQGNKLQDAKLRQLIDILANPFLPPEEKAARISRRFRDEATYTYCPEGSFDLLKAIVVHFLLNKWSQDFEPDVLIETWLDRGFRIVLRKICADLPGNMKVADPYIDSPIRHLSDLIRRQDSEPDFQEVVDLISSAPVMVERGAGRDPQVTVVKSDEPTPESQTKEHPLMWFDLLGLGDSSCEATILDPVSRKRIPTKLQAGELPDELKDGFVVFDLRTDVEVTSFVVVGPDGATRSFASDSKLLRRESVAALETIALFASVNGLDDINIDLTKLPSSNPCRNRGPALFSEIQNALIKLGITEIEIKKSEHLRKKDGFRAEFHRPIVLIGKPSQLLISSMLGSSRKI